MADMTPERWQRAKAIFGAALEADAASRTNVIAELSQGDAVLEADVRRLIESASRRGFVDELVERLAEDAATPPAAPPPARIGRYEVLGRIGAGGMGVVYKARDPGLDRLVAIKVIAPTRGVDREDRDRFLREARTTAALDHPSVATIYEVGETEDGEVFLALAYYDGETLAERLSRGPLPLDEVIRVAREIAAGLAAAHARRIIHRDLKPANVLVTRDGAVKIVDFGIASMAGAEQTIAGELAGTPAYMSPEQLRGEVVGATADVWAFGVLLHEMATGRRPGAVAVDSTDRTLGPADLRPDLPGGLQRIIERALQPSPHQRFQDGAELRAALADQTAAPRSAEPGRPAYRVPAPVTRLVGRERELEELRQRLSVARLLTLTGPGGTGKTRLGIEVAASVRDRFPDGVVFVPLAPLSDPLLVPGQIAGALGVIERPSLSPIEALVGFLAERRLLLLLDNFEHVALAASSVAQLLAECPELHVLVTTRVPLKVAGEHEYLVRPLRLPEASAAVTVEGLERCPATSLFLERARAVRPDLQLTDEQAAAVAGICGRLDGLPLGIELAAARVKLLSPAAILARFDRRFDWLDAGGPDRPARHRSLRQAIAWSHDLLSDAERTVFRRLAVFAGSGNLDDVVAVTAGDDLDPDEALQALAGLVDHSLVLREDGPDGQPRIRVLYTLREYALDRLRDAAEEASARRAHAGHFLRLVEEAEPHLTGPAQAAWFDRLEADHDNLRAALGWAQAGNDADVALRFGAVLWRFWAARGHLREGRERLERLLSISGAREKSLLRARVLNAAGTLVHEISDYPAARPLIEESLAIARAHQDARLTALVLNNFAWLLARLTEQEAAEAACEEALALNRELGDRRGIAIALHNFGWLMMTRGEYDRARALHQESAEWRRAQGDERGSAFAEVEVAWAEISGGRLDGAAARLAPAIATFERLNDRQLLAWARTIEGLLHRAEGRSDAALDSFGAAVALWRGVGNIFGLGYALVGDAEAALDRDLRERATHDLDEAIPLLRRTGGCLGVSDAMRTRARLAALEGDDAAARAHYTEAMQLFSRQGDARAARACQELAAALPTHRAEASRSVAVKPGP